MADTETARRRGRRRQHRIRELRALLNQLVGSNVRVAAFMPLVQRAVANKWSAAVFLAEIRTSRPFRRMFPGIPDTWDPGQYREWERQIRDIAADFGIRVDRRRLAALARSQKSSNEFYNLALIFDFVRSPEGQRQRELLNQILKPSEKKQLDNVGFFKLITRKLPDAEVYDIYESFVLSSAGIGITPQVARDIAPQLGAVGQLADVQEILDFVRENQSFVGPELERRGITAADLALLSQGTDPRGIRAEVERIVSSRRALAQGTAGAPARRVPAGIALFPEAEEGR